MAVSGAVAGTGKAREPPDVGCANANDCSSVPGLLARRQALGVIADSVMRGAARWRNGHHGHRAPRGIGKDRQRRHQNRLSRFAKNCG